MRLGAAPPAANCHCCWACPVRLSFTAAARTCHTGLPLYAAHPRLESRWSLKQRLQRLSPFVPGGRSGGGGGLPESSSSERDLAAAGAECSWQSSGKKLSDQSGFQIRASSGDQQLAELQAAEAAQALVDGGEAAPDEAAAVAATAAASAQVQAAQDAAGMVERGSLSFTALPRPGAAAGAAQPGQRQQQQQGEQQQGEQQQQQQPAPRPPEEQLSPVRQQQQQLEQQLGCRLSVDLEAQQQPGQAARLAAESAAELHSRSSVFRRCCPWALPLLPWHRRQRARRISQSIERSASFAATYRGPDAAALFWFGRPRLLLWVVQFIYFEVSLSGAAQLNRTLLPCYPERHALWCGGGRRSSRRLRRSAPARSLSPAPAPAPRHPRAVAAVLFSLWQHVDFDWGGYGGWPFAIAMICALAWLGVAPCWAASLPGGSLCLALGAARRLALGRAPCPPPTHAPRPTHPPTHPSRQAWSWRCCC